MTAIIVDDEHHAILALKALLKNYCSNVTVVAEATDAKKGMEVIRKHHPDIAFVDISMPGKSGLEMVQELKDTDTEFIFVTAHSEFTLQALRLSALDYLLKPINEDELVVAVEKASQSMKSEENRILIGNFLENAKLQSSQDMKICFSDLDGYHIRKVADILYCEAENTYTRIVMSDGEKLFVSKPLITYESLLSEAGFMRIHKTYLINLSHLRSFQKSDGGYVVLDNGTKIDVSKRKKEQVISYIKQIFNG